MSQTILLAAGGTGGHLFPAEALAHVLRARGWRIALATDNRAGKFAGDFPADEILTLPAATPRGGGPAAKVAAAATLGKGVLAALAALRRLRPAVVVGFGGYPTVPPLVAAGLLGVPTLLHEQNAVMGKANRFLAGRASRVASGFPLERASDSILAKAVVTGNPLRPAALKAAQWPFPEGEGRLNVLVTGGSQGARVMADVVPAAVALLNPAERAQLGLTQQARGEDETRVRQAFSELGFSADIAPFFKDLPRRIADAHLVVARSGASTVSELAAIGRPCVLVPFPFALDADQAANAAELARTGAALVIDQKDFTPARLASELRAALSDRPGLARRAQAAKTAGVPDAAERLADEVLGLVRK